MHGSIYEYMQNRDLNAVDAKETHQGYTSNPRYDNNRIGATIGGRIIKDKLFYSETSSTTRSARPRSRPRPWTRPPAPASPRSMP